MAGPNPLAPIVVSHETGLAFSVQIGRHRLTVDQSVRGGGDDAGPSPLDLLGASLGACVAFYVHQFCHARALSSEGLRVEVVQHTATTPHRVKRFDVRVILPATMPEEYIELVERVARSCPSHGTLTHGSEVVVTTERSEGILEIVLPI
jgi:uncharacterized OsmC-like protein